MTIASRQAEVIEDPAPVTVPAADPSVLPANIQLPPLPADGEPVVVKPAAVFVEEDEASEAETETETETESKPEEANILVMISAFDEIVIDRRIIDPRAVRANIQRLHAENPSGSVVIQPHKNSTNKMLVTVMDASRQAGVYTISIADRT